MIAVILTIHVLIVLGLIVVVLLQRSEGGALGMGGGGGGGGGFMTGRGAANALTRTTSILAALFFATSLGLAIFANQDEGAEDVIDALTGTTTEDASDATETTTDDLLRSLGGDGDDAAPDAVLDAAPDDQSGAPVSEAELLDALGAGAAPAIETPAIDAPAEDAPTEDADTAEEEPEPTPPTP